MKLKYDTLCAELGDDRSLEDVRLGAGNLLGALTPYWMTEPVWKSSSDILPPQPLESGSCRVLIIPGEDRRFPSRYFRSAPVLPLRWSERSGHDSRLPLSFINLAEEIRGQNNETVLFLAWDVEDPPDLSDESFVISAYSAWGPLTAALILAREGIVPKRSVWASTAYSHENNRLQAVGLGDDLAKLETAANFYPYSESESPTIFLPPQNYGDVKKWDQTRRLNIEFLDFSPGKDPKKLLKPYLDALREKPSLESDFEIKRNYYFTLPWNKPVQFEWFRDALLEETVRRARAESRSIPEITDLVVVYSGAETIIQTLVSLLEPKHLHILFDREFVKKDDTGFEHYARDRFTGDFSISASCFRERNERLDHALMAQKFGAFFDRLAHVPMEKIAVDCTTGMSWMSVILSQSVKPGVWQCYIPNEMPDGKKYPVRFEYWKVQ